MRSRFLSWASVVLLGAMAAGAAVLGSTSQATARTQLRAAVDATSAAGYAVKFGGPQHPLTVIVDQDHEELVSHGTVIAYFTSPDAPLDSKQAQIPYTSYVLVPAYCGASLQFIKGGFLLPAELSAQQLATDPVSSGGGAFTLTTGKATRLQITVRDGIVSRLTDLREIAGRAVPERVDQIVGVGKVSTIVLPRPNDVFPSSDDDTSLGSCATRTLPPDFAPF